MSTLYKPCKPDTSLRRTAEAGPGGIGLRELTVCMQIRHNDRLLPYLSL